MVTGHQIKREVAHHAGVLLKQEYVVGVLRSGGISDIAGVQKEGDIALLSHGFGDLILPGTAFSAVPDHQKTYGTARCCSESQFLGRARRGREILSVDQDTVKVLDILAQGCQSRLKLVEGECSARVGRNERPHDSGSAAGEA